jgi:hypothetical protein
VSGCDHVNAHDVYGCTVRFLLGGDACILDNCLYKNFPSLPHFYLKCIDDIKVI